MSWLRLDLGHQSIQLVIYLQLKMAAELGKPKRESSHPPDDPFNTFDLVSAEMNELL